MGMTQLGIVVVVLAVFGFIGFRRGWLRELVTLGVVLLGWLMLTALGWELVATTNRIWLILRFTFEGGFDAIDANAMLRQLRAEPLIDPNQPDLLYALHFLLAVAVGYLASRRLAPPARTVSSQLLGGMAGVVNGYVLTYVLLRYAAPVASLSLSLDFSTSSIADTLGQYLSTLLLLGVALVICIALLSATRLGASAGRRTKGSG